MHDDANCVGVLSFLEIPARKSSDVSTVYFFTGALSYSTAVFIFMPQLTGEDVSLWKDKVDRFGGTELDAAVNIILLDDYFDREQFQRDKFKGAIGAGK